MEEELEEITEQVERELEAMKCLSAILVEAYFIIKQNEQQRKYC